MFSFSILSHENGRTRMASLGFTPLLGDAIGFATHFLFVILNAPLVVSFKVQALDIPSITLVVM